MDALQKEGVKKTAVERALATLVENGQVNKKEYGKAKIFLLAQDKLDLPDAEDMASTDAELRALSERKCELDGTIEENRSRLAHLKSQYTLENATERVQVLTDELTTKLARRERLGDGSALMSKEDKLNVEKAYSEMRSMWKKYSSLVKGIVDQISEATGKKRSELYEDIGIETDEDVKVNFTDFPDIDHSLKGRRGALAGRSTPVKRQRLS